MTFIAVAFLLMLGAAAWAWWAYGAWRLKHDLLVAERTQFRQFVADNRIYGDAHQKLQNSQLQICNRRGGDVTLQWLAAVYADGGKLVLVDTARCIDWKPVTFGSGDERYVKLSSIEPGCDWSAGTALFTAIDIKEARWIGSLRGLKDDCFTLWP